MIYNGKKNRKNIIIFGIKLFDRFALEFALEFNYIQIDCIAVTLADIAEPIALVKLDLIV